MRSLGFLALSAALLPCSSMAGEVVVVMGSDLKPYRQALEGFQSAFGETAPVLLMTDGTPRLPEGTRVVLAVGSKAALASYPADTALVYCMAPGLQVPPSRGGVVRVMMAPKPAVLAASLRRVQPGLKTLGVLWASAGFQVYMKELGHAASAAGVQVVAERLSSPDEVPQRLRALQGRIDALWIPPDPLLVSAQTLETLRAFSWGNDVPYYGSSAGMLGHGASATVSNGYQAVGEAAAKAVQGALDGELPYHVYPPSELHINEKAAAEAGLKVPVP